MNEKKKTNFLEWFLIDALLITIGAIIYQNNLRQKYQKKMAVYYFPQTKKDKKTPEIQTVSEDIPLLDDYRIQIGFWLTTDFFHQLISFLRKNEEYFHKGLQESLRLKWREFIEGFYLIIPIELFFIEIITSSSYLLICLFYRKKLRNAIDFNRRFWAQSGKHFLLSMAIFSFFRFLNFILIYILFYVIVFSVYLIRTCQKDLKRPRFFYFLLKKLK